MSRSTFPDQIRPHPHIACLNCAAWSVVWLGSWNCGKNCKDVIMSNDWIFKWLQIMTLTKVLFQIRIWKKQKKLYSCSSNRNFPWKMNNLTSWNSRVPCSSCIRNLDPFLYEGLIRVGGRQDSSSMPAQMKLPVICQRIAICPFEYLDRFTVYYTVAEITC